MTYPNFKVESGYHNIWYPCSQMKDYDDFTPIEIKSAKGSYIELTNGEKLIDAISSWWCKSLGHNHPKIKEAIKKQIDAFEHVLMPNTQNIQLNKLSHKLSSLLPGLDKVFYTGDGSCAVEVALKMSVHARLIKGENSRIKFLALENGYHGETVGALSVSDLGLYKKPYESMLFDCEFIKNIPYVTGVNDPLWHDCSDVWPVIETQLEEYKLTANAFILEPLMQGAGGMLIYSKDFLQRIADWCHHNNVYLIYDEIMTGIGRSGKMLACHYLDLPQADFICLSKGLTSGWLPFSAVLTHQEIYNLFYDDYEKGKSFLHSHTYCGNALGVSVALAALNIFNDEKIIEYVQQRLSIEMLNAMTEIADETDKITNIRSLGGLVAADLVIPEGSNKRYGFELYKEAIKNGALLRPLGNTIYWLPPLNTSISTIERLKKITLNSIMGLEIG
ncbi:adenosylmethionine--8-amino-7-oxononanoate transaminase [Francisellaceae bacterium]|nr:adenosylmethionine--8-amino-7-oxononanoate transaminase [Francisellaceae bacterium]